MKSGHTVWDRVIMALLVIDGAAIGVLSVFFLPLWVGGVPMPVTVLVAGIANLLLVRAAANYADRLLLVSAPLLAWGAVFLILALSSPGGSVIVPANLRAALLVLVGVLPAAIWVARRGLQTAEARGVKAGVARSPGTTPGRHAG